MPKNSWKSINALLGLKRILDQISRFMSLEKFSYMFFFALGVILRGIPELLIPQYPVGYETITYYAPAMMSFYGKGLVDIFLETFGSGPLFYVLMWFSTNISGAHAFLILKVTGPVLYGFLALAFFVFVRRGLNFEWKMAFVATLILVVQPVALRESWDRFRTVLGLVFLFFTLATLKGNYRFKWPLVAVFGAMTALSREYVAVVLFFSVLGLAILEKKDRVASLVALAPALGIFVFMFYPTWLCWNYLSADSPFVTGSYSWMVQDVFSIFAVCYLPLLPFVMKGFSRYRLLDPMVGLLLFGSFSVVVSPWFAVPGYQRWLMLLVFPFTVYAIKGFQHINLFSDRRMRMLKVIVLIFLLVGVGYATGVFSYVGVLPNSYVAVNLVQSSIAWNQVDDVKGVLRWLDENAVSNSSMLSEDRFYGWTLIYLERANKDVKVIWYGANFSPTPALDKALCDGFKWIYLIWDSDLTSKSFKRIFSQNDISIFRYEPQIQ